MSDDWRTTTQLKGTVSRLQQWVRGTCARCEDVDVLVYDTDYDATLLCAECSRKRSLDNPRVELCDDCGDEPAWRDPVSGKNEFFCAKCHGARGTIFQNRWANKARTGRTLGLREKPVCYAADITVCKGEVKPRGGEFKGKLVCNKHAGKKSANEANN